MDIRFVQRKNFNKRVIQKFLSKNKPPLSVYNLRILLGLFQYPYMHHQSVNYFTTPAPSGKTEFRSTVCGIATCSSATQITAKLVFLIIYQFSSLMATPFVRQLINLFGVRALDVSRKMRAGCALACRGGGHSGFGPEQVWGLCGSCLCCSYIGALVLASAYRKPCAEMLNSAHHALRYRPESNRRDSRHPKHIRSRNCRKRTQSPLRAG
jgi:hypothetical protein